MKTITMNRGFEVKVDDADFDELSKTRWLANVGRKGYVYAVGQIDGKRHWMHRHLCGEPGLVVDHINGDTLDNRRSNLRSVTAAANASNLHCAPRSNTGTTNVHQRKRDGYYVSHSSTTGKRVYLGSYAKHEDAAEAVRAYEAVNAKETIPALLARIAELQAALSAANERRAA